MLTGFDLAFKPILGQSRLIEAWEVENNLIQFILATGTRRIIYLTLRGMFTSEKVADEYLWAHADSKVTYTIPEGMRRFTCMAGDLECGITCGNRDIEVTIRVNSQDKPIYHAISPNWEPIDLVIPTASLGANIWKERILEMGAGTI